MKTYINFPVRLERKETLDDDDWKDYTDLFEEFEKDFTIWSKRSNSEIVIIPQKINLDEKDMARFLENLEDFWKNIHLKSNIHEIQYQAEPNRIIVNIITTEFVEFSH